MGWGEPHAVPLHGRALLEALGPLLEPARAVRYENPTSFGDVTDHELELAARGLRALSYSCSQGARLLDGVREARSSSGNSVPDVTVEDRVEDLVAALEESVKAARASAGADRARRAGAVVEETE